MSPLAAGSVRSGAEDDVDGLDFLWLEVTSKCNLECVHCYVSSTPHLPLYGDMECQDWKDVMEEAYECGCRRLQFIGGEPTIHPDLPELISHSRDIGYEFVEVFSNGTVLTDELKRCYLQNQVKLAFSVYAPQGETHDAVTQRSGSFEKTIETIRWALEHNLEVRVGVIDMPRNGEAVKETCAFLRSLGVESVGVDRARGIGRGADRAENADPFEELCGACWKGKLCVSASGEIFPCIMARDFTVGTQEEGIGSVLNGKSLNQFRLRQAEHQSDNGTSASCGPDECSPDVCSPKWPCEPSVCYPKSS